MATLSAAGDDDGTMSDNAPRRPSHSSGSGDWSSSSLPVGSSSWTATTAATSTEGESGTDCSKRNGWMGAPQEGYTSSSSDLNDITHGKRGHDGREQPARSMFASKRTLIPSSSHLAPSLSPVASSSSAISGSINSNKQISVSLVNNTNDAGFVETTSARAACELAKYWNDVKRKQDHSSGKGKARAAQNDDNNDASDEDNENYVVVARIDNGKRIYRVRPRSRPPSALASSILEKDKAAQDHLRISASSKRNGFLRPDALSVRLTRSIPNLRVSSASEESLADSTPSVIYRDGDGYYRPSSATSSALGDMMLQPVEYLGPSNHSSTSLSSFDSSQKRQSTLYAASSITDLRSYASRNGSDADIFSKLVNWRNDPHTSRRRPAHMMPQQSFVTAHTHISSASTQFDQDEHVYTPGANTPVGSSFPFASDTTPNARKTGLPQSATTGQLISPSRNTEEVDVSPSNNRHASPFGKGVRLPSSSRLRRKRKSLGDAVESSPEESRTPVPVSKGLPIESPDQELENVMAAAVSAKIVLTNEHQADMILALSDDAPHRLLRETSSTETIRDSARLSDDVTMRFNVHLTEQHAFALADGPVSHIPAVATDEPVIPACPLDTRIFDVFQSVDGFDRKRGSSSTRSSLHVGNLDDSRHLRGMSVSSLASVSSAHSSSSATSAQDKAHDITVTAAPGDDPRFVIWGIKRIPGLDALHQEQQKSRPSSSEVKASPSASGLLESPPVNPGMTSRRWSTTKRQSVLPDIANLNNSSPISPASAKAAESQRVLMAATIHRWVAEMTSKIESDLMTDFFLTYRCFMTSLELCQLLITRFEWALVNCDTAEDLAARRIVRVRTYVVIRHWLLNYFHEDFVPDRELRLALTDWLNRMGKDERLRANSTDLRLVKSLKKVIKRLKAAYSTVEVTNASNVAGANGLTQRSRANTMSSIDSRGMSGNKSDAKGTAIATQPAENAFHSQQDDSGRHSRQATSSSEDDVDLNIDIYATNPNGYDSDEHPAIPRIIPISPPRPQHTSPRTRLRSPGSMDVDRSSRFLSTLPAGPDNTNRFSRYLTSTVGSLGKLKKIVRNRTVSQSAQTGRPELVPGEGDLLYKRAELNSYLDKCGFDRSAQLGQPAVRMSMSAQALSLLSQGQVAEATTTYSAVVDEPLRLLHHMKSNQTIRNQRSISSLLSKKRSGLSVKDDKLKKQAVVATLAPAAEISRGAMQLDDVDSSDESDEGSRPKVVKTLRRLPAGRNLRTAATLAHLDTQQTSLAHRHSIDTISSYATHRAPSAAWQPIRIPSFATYDSNSSANDADVDDAVAINGVVPFFVPITDSDDEEAGDVEAALRRLEGQVDNERAKSNARRVEAYLLKSAEAKANGGILVSQAEDDEEMDDNMDIPQPPAATQDTVEKQLSIVPTHGPDYAHDDNTRPATAIEAISAPTPAINIPVLNTPSESLLPVPAIQGKRVQRKSSVYKLFRGSRASTFLRSVAPVTQPVAPPAPPAHRPFLREYKTDLLARHFCIIERDLLDKVSWQELISGVWKQRLDWGELTDWEAFLKQRAKYNANMQTEANAAGIFGSKVKKAGDVHAIIQRFNLMCHWIASEIVLTTSTTERALLIAKIIRLAFKCYRMYNFQTLTQLIHGLQSPHIERLKRTWSRVPAFEMRLFGQLKFFCSHLRNFRLLRDATEKLISQWGPPGQDADTHELEGAPGAIPFFGLILRDLAVTGELPTYLDPSSPREPANVSSATVPLQNYAEPMTFIGLPAIPSDMPLLPLINVHKYRAMAAIVQKVMTCKEMANHYPYEPDLFVYRKCLSLHCLPTQLIAQLSTVCEK